MPLHPFAYIVTSPIKIDIWSDIACPWCYIGKRHLEGGIAALGVEAPDVEIEYHSFELAPDTRTTRSVLTIPGFPSSIAVGGGAAWIVDSRAGTVTRVEG